MPGTRILSRAAAVFLVICGLALPAAADGLSRFQEAIKKAPDGALKFKSAKTLGDNGFVLEDVVLTPPPDKSGSKTEPVAIKRLTVEDFDFASTDKNVPPNFIKMRAEGIAIAGKPAEGVDLNQMAGIDKLTLDFQLDYRLDPDRKALTLNRLELDLTGLARLELSMILDGVTAEQLAKTDSAMNDVTLRTGTLTFEDRTLLGKALPAAAKSQGSDADALVKMGKTMLEGMRAGQGPETLAVIDALASYMDDYKQPKGPLKITMNPPSKTTFTSLGNTKTPGEAVKALGLVVSYAGTKPGPAAPAAAPASAPSSSAGGGSGCTAGARFFVMHEDAYWAVTVREGKDDQCVARVDGSDDDVTFPVGKTLAWTLDGPGKAIAKCETDAKVLVENDGGWYPAKITDKPFTTGQCAIKFDGADGDEDTVAMKKVRRLN